MDSEYVPVSKEFKIHVFRRDGSVLNDIRQRSGAIITSRDREEGVAGSGNDQQRETAKRPILEKEEELVLTTREKVEIPTEYKGFVIGKYGANLLRISKETGAEVIRERGEVYIIRGNKQQRDQAKLLIKRRVEEKELTRWEKVEIPTEYKGLVIGKQGASLLEISKETGAKVTRVRGEVYIIQGTKQQRDQAKLLVKSRVALARRRGSKNNSNTVSCFFDDRNISENCKLNLERVFPGSYTQFRPQPSKESSLQVKAKLRGVRNKFYNYCAFIDGWNLSENCKLKLVLVPGKEGQYRLRPSSEEGQQKSVSDSRYLSKLQDAVLESLCQMKSHEEGKNPVKADIWCHFGSAVIRRPSEGEWSIDDATTRFEYSADGDYWKVALQEGVDFMADLFENYFYENTPKEYRDYVARFDLTFLTPCSHQLKCKVWVVKKDAKEKLKDIPTPAADVRNIMEEIHFTDESTRSRCRGWVVLRSRRYLQADILFPGCEFDCRLLIDEHAGRAKKVDYAPDEEVIRVLARYLSGLILTDDEPFGLRLPEQAIPEGFHLTHVRLSKRNVYTSKPGFSVILSKEKSLRADVKDRAFRKTTDVHLHCEEWDRLLSSGQWQPEDIVKKLPEFLEFVKEVQSFVVAAIKRNGIERKVPPTIRARGPLALATYLNALADGQACVKRVPLMIVGQDRSGKTSVKKSLKGICFNPDEDSTLGIEVDRYQFKVTTEIWKTGEKDEESNFDTTITSFEHSAARWIADKLPTHEKIAEVKRTSSAESAGYEVSDTPEEREPNESKSYADLLEPPRNPASTNTTDDEPHLPTKEVPNPSELEPDEDLLATTREKLPDFEDVAKLVPKHLRDNWEDGKEDSREDDKEDIYSILWDFAGQSVYYVTHPLFLTRRAIYFLVYDLSRNPSDKASPLVKQGVHKTFNADKYNLKTNFDYLDFWMSSLAALEDPETVLPFKKFPAVFLVCTHADQPYCARDPVELAKEIFGDLRTKPYGAHLFDVFCVDNTKSGTKPECEEIVRLRDGVRVVSKELPHVTEAIPIKWLKYEKALRALKESDYKFISLVTAKEIASKDCNINDNEIQTVLNFLHDLRVLIHFDDSPELSELVFLDIQWLIDVFKNVITVRTFHEEKNFAHLWERLEREGILEEKLLKHVWNSLIPQREAHESLIAIMEKFSLLCPWPSSQDFPDKQYIVPSMLRTRPPEEISNLVESAKIPSLFIKFDTGRVPPGLFPRFVLEFLLWCGREFPRFALPQLFHNFARFNNFPNQGLSLVLLCHSSTIEVVVVSANGGIDMVNMASIQAFRSQLTSIISQVWDKFFWVKNVGCDVYYLCHVCSRGRTISLCKLHYEEGCKQEECLHFISELDLGDETQAICTKSVAAVDNRIQVEKFYPWISCAEKKGLSSSNVAARSHGEAYQINRMKSATALKVTLLGSEWSSSMGGLSTINRQLAIHLAKDSEVDVTLLVPQFACFEDERRKASSHNVSIQEAKKLVGFSDPLDWLSFPPRDLDIDFVLGHGAKLGKQAQVIRNSHNCKWIQVVHTAPEELAMHKNYPEAISKGEEKNLTEVELCKLADAVLAVGPKLTDAFSAQLRSCKSQEDILQLTPGTFREFYDVKQAEKESNKFKVLTFGRGDPEDFSLKGYDISARAIFELKDRSYSLIFVGAPEGKQDEVAANLLKSGIDKSQLIVRKFVQSKEKLKELFCEVDLCIMPSRTEGFGLTALEALSAGLPILVSGNSGFGEALCTVPSGKSFVVESEDPGEWAKAIAGIRQKERSDRLQDIQQLRSSYEEKFSWKKQCDILVERMWDIVRDSKRQDTRFKTQLVEVDSLLTLGSLGQIIQKLQQMQLDASKVKSRTDLSLWLRNIASVRGFRISDNEGLGNCMFYALSEQLEIVMGIKIPSGELRQILVQYLRSNPKLPDGTDLFHFVHGHQTWTEYLECMEQDGVWGDHVILCAAANYFQTCIRVVSSLSLSNDVIITPHCPFDESKPFVLGHIHEVHYVSLQPVQAPVGENKDEVPPEIRARGPQALEAYNNALAEGQACVKRVPLMIVGQDRSGKTSVKKSLKGICFNPDEDSTRGIEVDRYDFKVTTEIWKTGGRNEEANIDATVISYEYNTARWMAGKLKTHEKIAEVKKTSSAEPAGYDFEEIDSTKEREPSETLSDAIPQESFINPVSTNATDLEPNLSTKGVRNPTELEPEEDSLTTTLEKLPDFDDVAKVLSQFFQENREDDQEDVYSILWDFAGQSVYYVTHPLFLTRRAIYFLVYDLSRNPFFKATPLKKKGVYKPFTKDEYNLKTNFDYLDFWMSSLASLVSDCPLVSLKKFPAVFLVCTHADQPYCDRNPFELAQEIFGDLKSKPYGAHLFDVFCVDNTKSGTESECKEIMRLRAKVHVVSKELPHVIEPIPIKWLKYEKALRALKESDQKFISLSTAKKIAAKFCNINDHEVQTVLTFLHDLRVLIHFDDSPELNELVFLDIQWLIDVFKSVITVRAYDVERAHLWEDLEKKGILKESLLKHVWNSLVPQRETHESLIAIMEKFSLMCPWPSSDDLCNKHYLVPSMLRQFPSEKISNLVDSAQLPSLFLKFDTGRVPPGLFPRLVLEFFQWCREEFPDVRLPKPFRNFARFHIFPNQCLSLVLLCHSSTIEVIVLSVKSAIDVVDVDSIRAFRNQLTSIIDRVRKKFFWVKNVGCKVSFLCPVCSYGRVVSLCPQHHGESCKQEECLHFISESDLGDEKQVVCTNSDAVLDNRIHAEQFAPWISSGKEKHIATHQREGGPQFGKGISDGYQRKSPVLPSEAVAALQLQRLSVDFESDKLLVPFAQGGNEETSMIPCKSVTSVQLQPQVGVESDGKLVLFAQRNCQIQTSAANQLEPAYSRRDALQGSDGTLVPFSQGNGYESLVLPHKVSESLQLTSDPPKEVIDKLLHNLKLDDASLEDPKPETEKWIRCLTRNAKDRGRTDVVKYLREIMPAGTAGPMLRDTLLVQDIPKTQLKELTVTLSGRDDWELFAEKLGLTPAEIRFLDKRTMNQVLEVLTFAAKKYLITVGDLYDVLKDCGLPVIADIL